MSRGPVKSQVFVGMTSFFIGVMMMTFHGANRTSTSICGHPPSDYHTTCVTTGHDDLRYLGNQSTFDPPARKPGYVLRSTTYQAVYDKTWTRGGYPAQSCWGCRFATDVIAKLQFHTVLDAGTGNGAITRLM